jgi:hypothetical protein
MFQMPMSSPQITRMLGFSFAANAAPAVRTNVIINTKLKINVLFFIGFLLSSILSWILKLDAQAQVGPMQGDIPLEEKLGFLIPNL